MLSRESRNNPEIQDKNIWVKKLQQESWELELLVSGFSIILLSKLTGWLSIALQNVQFSLNMNVNLSFALVLFMLIVLLASYALIINLIAHLIFRGFWVGIVGLGSVAPNTEFSKLKYSKFFTKKLEKKVTKLDDLVIVVDKISSLIFTFAFLIIFFLISVGLYLASAIAITEICNAFINLASGLTENILTTITIILLLIYLVAGIIYMIDFLTLGFFKKYKWLSKIYYPIYHFMGWITLSFLYRTLYYNLISKFSKRKIGLILIPYLLVMILIPFFNFSHHIYFPEKSENLHLTHNYYSDLRDTDNHIQEVDIPSYIIKDNFLPVFLSYNSNDNALIKKLNPDFTPDINEGINSDFEFKFHNRGMEITGSKYTNQEKSLESLVSLYKIYLNDSLIENPKFYFKTNANKEEKGLFTMIDILDLPRGGNILRIKKVNLKDSVQVQEDFAFVPFWKE